MFKIDHPVARYKLFTFFMTDIYSGLCDHYAIEKIKQYLKDVQPGTLTKFEIDLLRRYADRKVTEEILFKPNDHISLIGNQTWILNNLNWLLSIRKTCSPLTSIFFNKAGDIP
jgi:hypothetical protein